MSERLTTASFEAPAGVDNARSRAMVVGAIGLIATIAGAFGSSTQFFQSYLVAFVYWTGVALGCLGLLMVQHLSGGAWGLMIRRILEASAKTIPLMFVLFLPIAFAGLPALYEWARPDVVAGDAMLQRKAPYLNATGFIARGIGYFAIWSLMTYLLTKWSQDQDGRPGAPYDKRFGKVSGPGLVVFGLTCTFAAVDWVMSLAPHWFSTIFGFLFIGGAGLAALALVITTMAQLSKTSPMSGVFEQKHFHDLGKLMFAFVMLYAYFSFSQFLIIWSANLPEELPWYLTRLTGPWKVIALLLVFGHFVLPFSLLLSADVKQNTKTVVPIALLLMVMRAVDLYWQMAPQYHHGAFHFHWMDVTAFVGVGGLWVTAYLYFLKGRPLLPVNDPYLREALASHGSH